MMRMISYRLQIYYYKSIIKHSEVVIFFCRVYLQDIHSDCDSKELTRLLFEKTFKIKFYVKTCVNCW